MTIDDYVRNIDEDGNPTFLVTDMKAFGAELLKMLCKELHVVGVPEVPILTEEEYAKMREKNIHHYSNDCSSEDRYANTSVFDHILEASKIKNEHKDNPVIYGEELAHGIRYHKHVKLRPNSEPVNEFFGWTGQDITYFMLNERKAFEGMPSNSSIKGLAKMYKKYSIEKAENEKKIEKIKQKLEPLEERLEEMRNSDTKFIMSREYDDFCSTVNDLLKEKNYKEMRKRIREEFDIKDYLNNLKVDKKSMEKLKTDVYEFIDIVKKEDDERLKKFFVKIEKKANGYDAAASEFNKLSKRAWKFREKAVELSDKEDKLLSTVNHYQGYLVASVAYPRSTRDKNLFYRTEEEIRKIYFEPVLKYNWIYFDASNPVWDRVWDKVLGEIKSGILTANAVANAKEVATWRQTGFI
jgi:hypothetical protein